MDKRESQRISDELEGKRLELQSVNQEIEYTTDKAKEAVVLLDRIKAFVSSFRLFAPTIEEYANQVEADKTIDAGNSFRGILYEIGKLLEAFKELIKNIDSGIERLYRCRTGQCDSDMPESRRTTDQRIFNPTSINIFRDFSFRK